MAGRVASKSDQFMESPLVVWVSDFIREQCGKPARDLSVELKAKSLHLFIIID